MNADEAKKAARDARIRGIAERVFVARVTHYGNSANEAVRAVESIEAAEAFELVWESRK